MADAICSIDDCVRPTSARGWCKKHYYKWYHHGNAEWMPPTPNALRTCSTVTCDRPVLARGLCRACYAAARWEFLRWRRMQSYYGISKDRYLQLLQSQSGGCAICEAPPGRQLFAVDHDHDCCPTKLTCGLCIRGLLCFSCNAGLGIFHDDADVLARAATYLRRE